ncbi:MAG: lipooligosaccharide transport system ATP-binding protein [Acidimicrobiaceae bacterium]|jgi:lipooligosaccharide transport system ATP-binding protein|nr:lipooligosaccharide transport system ATP-binding protein [Acidimicrobiaceae bacterium]
MTDLGGALVEGQGLTKRFGSFTAVAGIDFTVERGKTFGFLGPNGAGKTTVMRMIGCVSPVSEGSLRVLGMDTARDGARIRGRLGVVPQMDTLDSELTVWDNLLVYGRYFGLPRSVIRPRAEELLEFVQLTDRRNDRVDPLSGGMKRRLTIARALINEPDLLLLDEPTTGLDPQARHLVWERLWRLKAQGVTQVLTTHYMDEAEQLCDRLVIMDRGRIVAEGSPQELIAQHASREVVEFRFEDRAVQDAAVAAAGEAGLGGGVDGGRCGRRRLRAGGVGGRPGRGLHRQRRAGGRGHGRPRRAGRFCAGAQGDLGGRVLDPHRPDAGGLTLANSGAGVLRVVEREATVYRRLWRASVFSSFVTPVLFLAGIGVGLGGLVDERAGRVQGLSYLVFVTPGLLAGTAMQVGAGGSLWQIMAGTKWTRFFHGIVATPVTATGVYGGYLIWLAVRTAMSCAAFLLVAAVLGGVPSWWAVLALPAAVLTAAVLTAAAFAAPLCAFSATQETDLSFPLVIRLGVTPLFLFSATFFPLAQLPSWLRPAAWVSPLWHGVELCRAATTGRAALGGGPARLVVHVVVLVVLIACGAAWGTRTFTRRLAQ